MSDLYQRAEVSFELGDEIGQEGRNSQVFIARDRNRDTTIVVKRILKSAFKDKPFFAESQILKSSSHPNVVPIDYACEDNDYIYFALPYYANGSIKRLMSEKFLTVREIIRFASQFLMGLHNVHSKGLIHFDVKPDNILLSDTFEALLSDFGLAKHTDSSGVADQRFLYVKQLPPEYFNDDPYTRAYDIYQVGVTMYRMCNGNQVFGEQFARYGDLENFQIDTFRADVRSGEFPDRSFFLPHIPDKLRKTVIRCLHVEPESRYESALDIGNDLASIDGNDLDWQYVEINNNKQWTKVAADRQYTMSVDENGRSLATKTMNNRTIRVADFCSYSTTTTKIRQFLRTY